MGAAAFKKESANVKPFNRLSGINGKAHIIKPPIEAKPAEPVCPLCRAEITRIEVTPGDRFIFRFKRPAGVQAMAAAHQALNAFLPNCKSLIVANDVEFLVVGPREDSGVQL